MKKYLRVYLTLLRLNFSALLAYRASFINSLIGTLGWSIVSISSMMLLTSRTSHVFGWTRDELLAATGVYSIAIGIFGMLFSRNFERFSRIIHLGQLDTILVKPIDSQFMLSCWIITYASFFRLLLGIGFTWYILQKIHITLTLLSCVGFFVLLIGGILFLYSVWFLVITFTIWFTNLSNLVDFLYGFNNLGRYPSEIVRQTKNFFLLVFLPMTFVATLPIKVILQKPVFGDEILLLICVLVLFFFSRKFWKFALRFYTSASG